MNRRGFLGRLAGFALSAAAARYLPRGFVDAPTFAPVEPPAVVSGPDQVLAGEPVFLPGGTFVGFALAGALRGERVRVASGGVLQPPAFDVIRAACVLDLAVDELDPEPARAWREFLLQECGDPPLDDVDVDEDLDG